MVSSSSNFQSDLQSLAQTNDIFATKNESQTSTLCLTSPRCKCTEHRCIEHLLGGSGWLCLLSCSAHSKCDPKNEHLGGANDCSDPRVAQDALVLGSGKSVTKPLLQLPHWPHLLQKKVQSELPSESVVSEPSCLAPTHHSESLESFSEQVAERIKARQRSSSRRLYESRLAF